MTQTTTKIPEWIEGKGEPTPSLPNVSLISSDGLMMIGALIGLGVSSIRYAIWLNTPTGRKWDQQHTWFVTVIGVFITLAWLALHDPKAAIKAFGFFIVSGTPIVVRALSLKTETLEAFVNSETK